MEGPLYRGVQKPEKLSVASCEHHCSGLQQQLVRCFWELPQQAHNGGIYSLSPESGTLR